jgi:hypothetical protein
MLGQNTPFRRTTAAAVAPSPVSPPTPRVAPPPVSDLLKPQAVADLLHVSTKVLERWRGNGDGPNYCRLSRKTLRYQRSDIEAFIAARLRSSTAGD